MTIRIDNSIPIILNSNIIDQINDKALIREHVLNKWILEAPNVKYRYFVETLNNNNRIYLERPGRLNKGCDFVIYIENHIVFKNGNDKPPQHNFVLKDLLVKKNTLTPTDWQSLKKGIELIFKCFPFTQSYQHCANLPMVGESYELVLKILRWLFIEQDITYWSGKGRQMLYNEILCL